MRNTLIHVVFPTRFLPFSPTILQLLVNPQYIPESCQIPEHFQVFQMVQRCGNYVYRLATACRHFDYRQNETAPEIIHCKHFQLYHH